MQYLADTIRLEVVGGPIGREDEGVSSRHGDGARRAAEADSVVASVNVGCVIVHG